MNNWDDRAIDSGLQELHGSKPPDLSARVMIALQEGERQDGDASDLPMLERMPPQPFSLPKLAAALLFGLLVGLSVAVFVLPYILPAPPVSVQHAVAFEIDVLDGELLCSVPQENGNQGKQEMRRAFAGTSTPFVAQRGSRVHCDEPSTFRLGAFGVLTATKNTQLEVQDMAMDTKQGVMMASSLTLAVVAGVITWQTMAQTESANAGETVTLNAEAPDNRQLLAENSDLRNRLARLEEENKTLREGAERQAAPEVKPEPAVSEPESTPEVGMAFSDPRFADALAKIDWAKMGAITHEMSPVLAELVAKMTEEGAEIPMELAIKVQQLNSQLLGQIPALMEAGVPGFGANGSYTHPLVVANTLANTLQAAGQTMTKDQQSRLSSLVDVFSAEAQSIAESSHDLSLDQLLAEVEMKDRFFNEMKGTLTEEQSRAIYPGGSTKYEGGSLFHSGVMTRPSMKPIAAKNAADFAAKVSSSLNGKLGLSGETAKQVRDIIARGSAAAELWQHPAENAEMSQAHFIRSGRSLSALRSQVIWMRQIRQLPGLTSSQREKLGQMSRILIPLPQQ